MPHRENTRSLSPVGGDMQKSEKAGVPILPTEHLLCAYSTIGTYPINTVEHFRDAAVELGHCSVCAYGYQPDSTEPQNACGFAYSVDYDLSTQGEQYINGGLNIVTVTKTGAGLDTTARQLAGAAGQNRFYTSIVTCHDSQNYLGNGSYVPMAYASILAPYIPLWYIGEEWNNQYNSTGWLWANGVSWNQREKNRDYFETIKAYIRIRRLYPEIFEDFPLNHRDSNICAVETDHPYAAAKAYARYGAGKGIMVLPNAGELSDRFEVTVPYTEMGLAASGTYRIVNLLTGKTVAVGTPEKLTGFALTIPDGQVAVYVVESAAASEATVFAAAPDTADTAPAAVAEDTATEQRVMGESVEMEAETLLLAPVLLGIGIPVLTVAVVVLCMRRRKRKETTE